MRVLIAGGHGKIGRRLVALLAARGHEPVAMIRDPEQGREMGRLGAESLVADLTGDVRDAPAGCDAIVFAAGAGPGSGPEPKQHVDRGGAEKLMAAAQTYGIRRYVMVSAIHADDPQAGPDKLRPYLEAKRAADDALRASGLDHTIVRPGRLTEDPGRGLVTVGVGLDHGEVSRDDVAATIAATLERDDMIGQTFDLLSGDTPIDEALDGLGRPAVG